MLYESISQRGFAVVDVSDDAEIAYGLYRYHCLNSVEALKISLIVLKFIDKSNHNLRILTYCTISSLDDRDVCYGTN